MLGVGVRTKIVIVICLTILIVGGVNLYFIYSEYGRGEDEYNSLQSYVETEEENNADDTDDKNPDGMPTLKEAGIPELRIDDQSLLKLNKDYKAWLYIPQLEISYPVVQGEDNEYYLHHLFSGEKNSSGCIFIEAACKPDFTDYNTFVYGHNMKNGSMFGSLKRYTREEDLYDKASEFYIYLSDRALKYEIYSYYIVPPTSDSYSLAFNEEGYEEYIEKVMARSVRNTGIIVDVDRPTVTLATCSGTGENKKRLIIHGALVNTASR